MTTLTRAIAIALVGISIGLSGTSARAGLLGDVVGKVGGKVLGHEGPSVERRTITMRIFDTACPDCGATYKVAESETLPPVINHFACVVCKRVMFNGEVLRPKAVKLIVRPERATFHDPAKRQKRFALA